MNTTQSLRILTKPTPCKPSFYRLMAFAAGLAVLPAGIGILQAQSINVPNGSFEAQSGVGQPYGVNIFVDSWQKATKPAYFDIIEANYGFYWVQTAGVFLDTNPYGNRTGTQAGYILPYSQVALFQDYTTTDWNDAAPTHDFNAQFTVGKGYQLTVGLFAKNMTAGSSLQLSLYYRDSLNNPVTVGSTTITYSAASFPLNSSLNLIDYEVNVPCVQAGDAWAGQNIGIKLESLNGDGTGNWDFDNVRLTAVPEPASLGLLGFGLGGMLLVRGRFQRSA